MTPECLRCRQLSVGASGCAGIGRDRDLLAEDLLADAVAAALLREEASSLIRLARIDENIMKASRSATAAGSRTTAYFPGSMATGLFDCAALSIAVAASAAGSVASAH